MPNLKAGVLPMHHPLAPTPRQVHCNASDEAVTADIEPISRQPEKAHSTNNQSGIATLDAVGANAATAGGEAMKVDPGQKQQS